MGVPCIFTALIHIFGCCIDLWVLPLQNRGLRNHWFSPWFYEPIWIWSWGNRSPGFFPPKLRGGFSALGGVSGSAEATRTWWLSAERVKEIVAVLTVYSIYDIVIVIVSFLAFIRGVIVIVIIVSSSTGIFFWGFNHPMSWFDFWMCSQANKSRMFTTPFPLWQSNMATDNPHLDVHTSNMRGPFSHLNLWFCGCPSHVRWHRRVRGLVEVSLLDLFILGSQTFGGME